MNFLEKHIDILIEVIIIFAVMVAANKLIDFLDKKIKENIVKKHDNSTRLLSFSTILNRIIKTVVFLIIIASVMQAHGYSMTSLVAGFGIIGMAVSFAAKESIANIFGSFAILYDKIFDVGDYVVIGEVEGNVLDINLRSTKIKTIDNTIVTLPNNIVANSLITNVSATTQRRINEVIGITYDTSDEKITKSIEILKNILNNNEEITTNTVFLKQLNSSSIDIQIIAYIKYGDIDNFRRIRENIIIKILKEYKKEGIDFAFPSQTIYVNNEN
ncbi:MAG: mechanosensitive ion channel family protein [Candidatus Gastranaerophilaceae bacterium]